MTGSKRTPIANLCPWCGESTPDSSGLCHWCRTGEPRPPRKMLLSRAERKNLTVEAESGHTNIIRS